MKAYKAAKDGADGQQGINGALKQATLVPMGVAERAREVGKIAEKLRPITNPNMVPFTTFWARFASRIALLPIIAGVSYEIIRFAAKHRGSLQIKLHCDSTHSTLSLLLPEWRSLLPYLGVAG